MNMRSQYSLGKFLRLIFIALVTVAALATTGCGTIRYEAGRDFNPEVMESQLKIGASTQADVKAALGEPYGQGEAMLPWHDSPRKVWTYYVERGQIDMGGPGTASRRSFVFVFFQGNHFDSYLWFASTLTTPKAP